MEKAACKASCTKNFQCVMRHKHAGDHQPIMQGAAIITPIMGQSTVVHNQIANVFFVNLTDIKNKIREESRPILDFPPNQSLA